jgi:hypothetical protein
MPSVVLHVDDDLERTFVKEDPWRALLMVHMLGYPYV